ncbi:MAG: FKBP-type peptidyl-prolyl cis-trans isomerase [Methylobacillus sp.]|jgi:FKBP-type peptidyl-prolyl cis-trans isomerase FkpA|nr:FKBP-type peptidyl-prolyl cis-trans isomerase [Methylobacillus sp.]
MKNTFVVGAVVLVLFSTGGAMAAGTDASQGKNTTTLPKTVNDLVKIDQKVGTGAKAIPPAQVDVYFSGWLYDPTKPDGHGAVIGGHSLFSISFMLGNGDVILGWEEGITGMKVGGKRTLIVPPHMGYGSDGAGVGVPPNATLIFDVELLKVH